MDFSAAATLLSLRGSARSFARYGLTALLWNDTLSRTVRELVAAFASQQETNSLGQNIATKAIPTTIKAQPAIRPSPAAC